MGCLFSKENKRPPSATPSQSTQSTSSASKLKSTETKIINLARQIKSLVTPPVGSKSMPSATDATQQKIIQIYKEIIELAKKSTSLDGSVLDEVLMCGNAIRMNDPAVAAKLAYLSSAAKKLVEERTMGTEDTGTPTDTSRFDFGSEKSKNERAHGDNLGQLQRATPALMVSQIPKESSSRSTKLNDLTSDGLPPLKNFSKVGYADASQHSADFGFFDMSVHDRSGMPEWTGVTPNSAPDCNPIQPLKLQYSAAQLNVGNTQ